MDLFPELTIQGPMPVRDCGMGKPTIKSRGQPKEGFQHGGGSTENKGRENWNTFLSGYEVHKESSPPVPHWIFTAPLQVISTPSMGEKQIQRGCRSHRASHSQESKQDLSASQVHEDFLFTTYLSFQRRTWHGLGKSIVKRKNLSPCLFLSSLRNLFPLKPMSSFHFLVLFLLLTPCFLFSPWWLYKVIKYPELNIVLNPVAQTGFFWVGGWC